LPIGTNATFHCIAQGVDAYWRTTNRAVSDEGIEGFKYDPSTSTRNLTLSITALPHYNNTNIICVAYSDGRYSSPPAKLIVIGMCTTSYMRGLIAKYEPILM